MNTLEIEDRVRAATQAAADTVAPDSVPALRLPSDRAFRSREGSRSFASVWGRWLAPVAAAAAVAALALAMVTVGRTADHGTGGTGAAASSRPGPVRTGPPISSYVTSGRVPRYYVSIESHGGNPNFSPSYAVVRATATGASLGTVPLPAGQAVMAVTAAADDRTFMLDTQPWDNPNSPNYNQNFEARTFHELRLSSSGRILSVSKLSVSIPRGQLMTGFALSPDGSKLAIAVNPDNKRDLGLTEVKVITLATGATATWTADGTIGTGPDDARSLSWTANGRTLAFTWTGAGPGIHTAIQVLDVATGGGSLLADSREAVSLINQVSPGVTITATRGVPAPAPTPASTQQPVTRLQCQLDSIITPDGSAIVCGAIGPTGTILDHGSETGFIEYSTANGKVARILGYWTFPLGVALPVDVLWSDASGSVLIGVIPGGNAGRVGVISGNEFTPLPATASVSGAW